MKRVDITNSDSTQRVPALLQLDNISDSLSSPTQEPSFRKTLPCAENTTDDRALPFILNKRMGSSSMFFQPGMLAGFAFAILATGFGVLWWFGSLGNSVVANFSPIFDKTLYPEDSASPYLASRAPLKQPGHQAAAVSNTQAGNGKNENASKEIQSQTRAPRSLPIPEHQPLATVDTHRASGAGLHSPSDIASATMDSNDQPSKAQRLLSTPATGVTRPTDRNSDVSRVKAKTSAAMRKNQAKIVKAAKKSPPPNPPANRTSFPHSPANASMSVQKASLAHDFKQCKSKPSFFQREKCKWQVCAGNWGRDGCPAYNHDIARY